MRRWRWQDPVYGVHIELLRGGRGDELLTRLQRLAKCERYTDEELQDARISEASVAPYRPNDDAPLHLAIWFGHRVKHGTVRGLSTIGHEALHAAMAVFRDRKMPVTLDSEEPFAYYQTYLFTEILTRLRAVREGR